MGWRRDFTDLGGARDPAATVLDGARGDPRPILVAPQAVERRILEADPDVAAVRDRRPDQRSDVDLETGDHPRRARRFGLEQLEVGGERIAAGREAPGEAIREHEPVDRRRHARDGPVQRRAEPQKTGLVDRIAGVEAVFRGEREAMADVALGVQVDEALLAGHEPAVVREVDRAGVDHRPLQEAAPGQLLDRAKARRRRHRLGRIRAAGDRQGRIDDHVLLLADALDDPPIDPGIVALAAGRRVIGVGVDDRRPLLGAGDAVGHDLLDRDRDLGLELPPPRPVQRHFEPDRPLRHATLLPESGASSNTVVDRPSRDGDCGSGILQR